MTGFSGQNLHLGVASLGLRLDLAVNVLLHHLIMAASNRGEAFSLEKNIQKIYWKMHRLITGQNHITYAALEWQEKDMILTNTCHKFYKFIYTLKISCYNLTKILASSRI